LRFLPSLGEVIVPARRDSKDVLSIVPKFCRVKGRCPHDRMFAPWSDCENHDWHIFSRIFLAPFRVSYLQFRSSEVSRHAAIVPEHTAFPLRPQDSVAFPRSMGALGNMSRLRLLFPCVSASTFFLQRYPESSSDTICHSQNGL
jgi:hypothetical protein